MPSSEIGANREKTIPRYLRTRLLTAYYKPVSTLSTPSLCIYAGAGYAKTVQVFVVFLLTTIGFIQYQARVFCNKVSSTGKK